MKIKTRIVFGTALVAIAIAWLIASAGSPRAPRPSSSEPSSEFEDAGPRDGLAAPKPSRAVKPTDRKSSVGDTPADSPADPQADRPEEQVEAKIPLDAKLTVSVIHSRTRKPVPGAKVRATINIQFESQRSSGLEFAREAVSGPDGIARFDRFPSRTTVTIRVEAEGFRSDKADVNVGRSELDKNMAFALVPGLSERDSSVLLKLPAGVTLTESGAYVLDQTTGGSRFVPVGGFALVDADPDGNPEHEMALQLVLPGYAGPMEMVRLRRGTTLTLKPPTEEIVTQEVALVDENGRGVEGVALTVWPTLAQRSRARETRLDAMTDARGVAALSGYRGTTWEAVVDETRVHIPELLDETPVVVGGGLRTIRCGRRLMHRLVFEAQGIEEIGECSLEWKSFEPVPRSAIDRLFHDDVSLASTRLRRYLATLPTRVPWAPSPPRSRSPGSQSSQNPSSGMRSGEVTLLAGNYVVVPTSKSASGRPTTIQVTESGGETRMPLEVAKKIRMQITGSFDRSDGPLPWGTIVLAHRAGWDERVTIARVLGTSWPAFAVSPMARDGDAAGVAFSFRMIETSLSIGRIEAPFIGQDLAFTGRDGVAELFVEGTPEVVTVIFPSLAVACIPVVGDGTTYRGRVEPANFRALDVHVRTTGGDPFSAYRVCPNPVAMLRKGVREFAYRPPTDRDGHLRLGVLPRDVVGLTPIFDAWKVSAGVGTTIERLETADSPSFLVHTSPDVIEPAVEIVADPYEK